MTAKTDNRDLMAAPDEFVVYDVYSLHPVPIERIIAEIAEARENDRFLLTFTAVTLFVCLMCADPKLLESV